MQHGSLETRGFLVALFDFGFTNFITLRLLKVIYALLVGLILLTGCFFLFLFVTLLLRGEGLLNLFGIVAVPLMTLLSLVLARVYTEIIALFFRIGENTSVLAAAVPGAAGGPERPYPGPSYGGPFPSPAAPAGSGL